MVRALLSLACLPVVLSASCDTDELDLCDGIPPFTTTTAATTASTIPTVDTTSVAATTEDLVESGTIQSATPWFAIALTAAGFGGRGLVFSALLGEAAAAAAAKTPSTCGNLKDTYKAHDCCGQPNKELTSSQIVPFSSSFKSGGNNLIIGKVNPCEDKAVKWPNQECLAEAVAASVDAATADLDIATGGTYKMGPQAGGDVTKGYVGGFNTSEWYNVSGGIVPNKNPFHKGAPADDGSAGLGPLCAVNVHWHLGAEHRSEGQYDEDGVSPGKYTAAYNKEPMGEYSATAPRRLANAPVRYGFACKLYDATDAKFTTEYDWQHCEDMFVGETYEVHWPHSTLGACNTPYQYQTKFYDGIFCRYTNAGSPNLTPQQIASNVGVQSQVFTIVNDEQYYYPDLFKGMIVTDEGPYGRDLAIYAGSSTGTGRDNKWCSMYTPVTWQVDRKCHLISASSFDKLCADMKQNVDDMSNDLHPHGARELVYKALNAQQVFDEDHGDSGNGGHQQVPR